MIYDQRTETVIGHLGWIDQGFIWRYSLSTNAETRFKVDGARYLGMKPGRSGLFRVAHHLAAHPAVSIRHCANPGIELAEIRFHDGHPRFSGDTALWDSVDPSLILQTDDGPRLYFIDARRETALPLDLSWYSDGDYDLAYQGLVDSLTIRAAGIVVVSVQRSSTLVAIDIEAGTVIDRIMLAGRLGNPALAPLSESDFVASDYDTICVVDGKRRSVRHSPPLQISPAPDTQLFVGEFDILGTTCAVARPFSADVVLVDLKNFNILANAAVGGQPLEVSLLSGSRFLTRDWKTGTVYLGSLS